MIVRALWHLYRLSESTRTIRSGGVDDQEARRDQPDQFLLQRVVRPGGVEVLEHLRRLDHDDALVPAAGDVGKCVGDEGLANSDRSGEDYVLFAIKPFKADKPLELVAVERYLGFPAEALQHFGWVVVSTSRMA